MVRVRGRKSTKQQDLNYKQTQNASRRAVRSWEVKGQGCQSFRLHKNVQQ